MTSGADVSELIAKTVRKLGDRIDILVHVTGGLHRAERPWPTWISIIGTA